MLQRLRPKMSIIHRPNERICQKGMRDLQSSLEPRNLADVGNKCRCKICIQDDDKNRLRKNESLYMGANKSHTDLLHILKGLCSNFGKTIKIFIPDILFIVNDGLEIFQTNRKSYRICKIQGTTPSKLLYTTILRLRREYKGMLEDQFKKSMVDKMDANFMHKRYLQKLLPSHFHSGDNCRTLNKNVGCFKTYILHSNDKYIIPSIEEHKMNDKEPFCTIRYEDGTWQLFNQKQFQIITMNKLPNDIKYVQSFIKSKLGQQSICYSSYDESCQNNLNLYHKAQTQILILLGGLTKFDSKNYTDIEVLEDWTNDLMKIDPSQYAELMTYKIIHYLAMASSIFVSHIKIKWVINDVGTVYLQEIIELDLSETPKKIKYNLPKIQQNQHFYRESRFFVEVYKQMKEAKENKIKQIKKEFKTKNYEKIQHEKRYSNLLEDQNDAEHQPEQKKKTTVTKMKKSQLIQPQFNRRYQEEKSSRISNLSQQSKTILSNSNLKERKKQKHNVSFSIVKTIDTARTVLNKSSFMDQKVMHGKTIDVS